MNNNAEALSELIQRFAISALSIERKKEALNEEILVDKYSGEFYIKTKDGIVMSADIMNREKASTNEAIRIAELMGMVGELYKIEFDALTLPQYIDYGVNLFQTERISLAADTKCVLINLDLDEYDVTGDNPEIVHGNGNVKVVLEVISGEIVEYIEVNKNLNDIKYYPINITQTDVTDIRLIEVTINNTGDDNRAMLLHNMFITIDR